MKDFIISFCTQRNYPEEAIKALTFGWEQIISVPAAFDGWNIACAMYRDRTHEAIDQIKTLDNVSESCGINRQTLHLLFYLCQTDILKGRYIEEGIDLSVYEDTIADLKCKMFECYNLYGVYGCRVSGWLDGFFSMRKFALGRMQYEIRICDEEVTLDSGAKVGVGDKVLVMHVPVSDQPFSKENRLDSYKRAHEFFKDKFPNGIIPFRGTSWLLYPENRKILSSKSNIIGFLDEFCIVKTGIYENNEEMWRIFGKPYDGNPDSLERNTSLQRAYADWIKQGNKIGYGIGYFLYDGTNYVI